jgi:hypothetical protein
MLNVGIANSRVYDALDPYFIAFKLPLETLCTCRIYVAFLDQNDFLKYLYTYALHRACIRLFAALQTLQLASHIACNVLQF